MRDIKPILQLNCVGCHQSSRAGGGVHLDNDDNNDLLKEAIYATVAKTGKVAMPPNIASLSACDVAKIRVWALGETSDVSDGREASNLQVLATSSDDIRVRFNLDNASTVGLSVVSSDGRVVASLHNEWVDAGNHERFITTSSLAHGMYLVRLMTPHGVRTAKFLR